MTASRAEQLYLAMREVVVDEMWGDSITGVLGLLVQLSGIAGLRRSEVLQMVGDAWDLDDELGLSNMPEPTQPGGEC